MTWAGVFLLGFSGIFFLLWFSYHKLTIFVIFTIFLKGINKWPLFYLFIFSQEWYITCICIFIIPKTPHAQYCLLNLEPLHTNRVLAYFSLWLVMMLQMTELYFVNSSGWINVELCMYTFIFNFYHCWFF